ncbi:hypothetical protein Forpe1208_v010394 [Fusarium oxysporum f. sp. rapae]|uniref:Uncharacterized protein n=1 Tax=Fusarium oxysporum f. sp. rapae TaxID=485398 RepID=A0A8J5NSX0_FUSOX|nr:hypothetical protein Forpe1208_v010394 [Fusarium oxysporum f. sp. rapae]
MNLRRLWCLRCLPSSCVRLNMESLQDIYNSLGDVYEVSEKIAPRPDFLPALANLLVKHNLDKVYDIRLNHKHFDITGSEQVVSFTGQGLLVSMVYSEGGLPIKLLAAEGIYPISHGAIRPSDLLVKDGAAIPYEFTYTTNNPPPEPSSEFLESWCSILREEGVEGLLGLSIRDNGVPAIAHEVSDPENRVNRLVFGDDAPEGTSVIATTWRVLNVDGVVEAKKCTYCNNVREHWKQCEM